MKKILLLGGSEQQITAIIKAKNRGYHTILCDYIYDNPGRKYSDEFYCISTTDRDAILKLAIIKRIDGILAYATDPAVMTAAYVSRELELPSNPYDSTLILSRKDLFRKFLEDNDFNSPKTEKYRTLEEAKIGIADFDLPVLVKPVDSSGSKGISYVFKNEDLEKVFDKAIKKSRSEVIIIEEYIDMIHDCMIGGDGFIIDGKLEFCGFMNSHRDPLLNSLVPIGTSYPPFVEKEKLDMSRKEIQRLIDILQIKNGAINIEVMFDRSDKLYIIEIGARNGGNMIPDLLQIISGIDLVDSAVEVAMGNGVELNYSFSDVYYSTYVIHSNKRGELLDIKYSEEIEKFIIKKVIYKKKGALIDIFDSSDKALGIVFLKFGSLEELKYRMNRMHLDISVIVR